MLDFPCAVWIENRSDVAGHVVFKRRVGAAACRREDVHEEGILLGLPVQGTDPGGAGFLNVLRHSGITGGVLDADAAAIRPGTLAVETKNAAAGVPGEVGELGDVHLEVGVAATTIEGALLLASVVRAVKICRRPESIVVAVADDLGRPVRSECDDGVLDGGQRGVAGEGDAGVSRGCPRGDADQRDSGARDGDSRALVGGRVRVLNLKDRREVVADPCDADDWILAKDNMIFAAVVEFVVGLRIEVTTAIFRDGFRHRRDERGERGFLVRVDVKVRGALGSADGVFGTG